MNYIRTLGCRIVIPFLYVGPSEKRWWIDALVTIADGSSGWISEDYKFAHVCRTYGFPDTDYQYARAKLSTLI